MTLSTFKTLFEAYQESGLNVKDFCANQGLAPSSFYYWKKKLGYAPPHQPDSFVPLVFNSDQSATSRRIVPTCIPGTDTPGNSAPIEFVFPNGTKMLLRDNIDTGLLKAIVHLFD